MRGGALHRCMSAVVVATTALSAAGAYGAGTTITLDQIPDSVYEGQLDVFAGHMGSGGSPLYGAFVEICEDDPFVPDECLGSGTTDRQGRYAVEWTAEAALIEVDFDIYARFDGAGQYRSSQTPRQTMSVYEYDSGAYSAARDDSGTSLYLDYVPSAVWVGDYAVFEGTLTSSGGSPLPGRTVWICEDDPLWADKCLGRGTTDEWGRFSIPWVAEAAMFETDFDIYAEFDGDSSHRHSQTARHTMSVYKHGGSLVLDPVPDRAAYGDRVTLTGTLRLDAGSPENAIVYIKDEDFLNPDDLLASAYVDGTGSFETSWVVERVDPDSTIDIQAVFEGGSVYYRMATSIQKMYAYNSTAPPPDPDPPPADGYMELYYNLDFESAPRVAIVPAPDSYDEVRKHIVPVQEGILQLTSMLEERYPAGDWSVEFDVVEPWENGFESKPDIKIDLVTRDEDAKCGDTRSGVAFIYENPVKPVETRVCSLDGYTDAYVGATAAHEFVHAIGVGHTFNIPGDLLCSVEEDYGPTCTPLYPQSETPSPLNLAAVAAVYGEDGFANPNNRIIWGQRVTPNGTDPGSATAVRITAGSSIPGCGASGQCFVPYAAATGAGGEVVWRNSDNAAHTVVGGVPIDGGPGGAFDGGAIPPGGAFSRVFATPGEHPYFCPLHPWMDGVVTVSGAANGAHIHADIMVDMFGDAFPFHEAEYQMRSPLIRFENRDGTTMHKHAAGATLDALFGSLDIGLTDRCYVFPDGREFCTNGDYALRFFINRNAVADIGDYEPMEGDRILVTYGDLTAGETAELLDELDRRGPVR